MLHTLKQSIFLSVIGLLFFTCSKNRFEAEIPAYISVPSITLTTDLPTQGAASSNITDAWVYVNDDLVGVYELPAKFPVLKDGNVSLKIYAGIKDNGIAASRVRYLLYNPHVEQVNLIAGDTTTVLANVQYSAAATFPWMEDFEGASLKFLYTAGSDTVFNKQSAIVKDGQFSGQIYLEDEMDFFEATTQPLTSIPIGGTVYLEIDFKTNEYLFIGVYLDGKQFAHMTLNTTDDWRKIYINLKDAVKFKENVTEVKVFIGLKEENGSVFKTTNPQIYIDNVKLVHS